MEAINKNKSKAKIYGWFELGANGSTNNKTNASKGIPSNFPSAYDAVSYTHLDVYKRQKQALERKIDLQVELANAANACLLAELWSGRLDGIRNAVLITISERCV